MPTLRCPVCGANVEPLPVLIQTFPRLTMAAQALLLQCACGVTALVGLSQPTEPSPGTAATKPRRQSGYDEPYIYSQPSVDRPQPFTLQELSALMKLRGRTLDDRLQALSGAPPAGEAEGRLLDSRDD